MVLQQLGDLKRVRNLKNGEIEIVYSPIIQIFELHV